MCEQLTRSLNDTALLTIKKSQSAAAGGLFRRNREQQRELDDLLDNYKLLHNRLKSMKRRMTDRRRASSICRRREQKLYLHVMAAKKKFEVAADSHSRRGWNEVCSRIQGSGGGKRVAWNVWKKVQPSSRLAPNAVTVHQQDPLPSSMTQSCQNMAEFYSKVMSNGPIPSWSGPRDPSASPSSSSSRSPPPPPQQHRDDHHDHDDEIQDDVEDIIQNVINSGIENKESPMDEEFSVEEIEKQLKGIRLKTASGPDEIPASFLRHAPPSMVAYVAEVFNASWEHGVFPTQWKLAKAFTIFKKGDRSDPSAYRVISITSTIARVFERVVKCRMTEYLENAGFFAPEQAGFRHGKSTQDQIYRLQRDIHTAFTKRKQLPVVFLDIVKAFDRVPHDRLLYKLHKHAGISGKCWGWVRAFLTDRQFFVAYGATHKSKSVFARAGVPQGTVLAPLLFIIYINDLFPSSLLSSLKMNAALFADDACAWPCLSSCSRLTSQYKAMRALLHHCSVWSRTWKLEFSVDKTQVVLFHRKRYQPNSPNKPFTLCDRVVSFANVYKYLGVLLDSDGSYRSHVTQLITKTKITSIQLSRIFSRSRPPSPIVASTLVQSILIPQITYGIQFITKFTKKHIQQLTQVIASPLRRALGLPRSTSAQRVLWEYGLPDVGNIILKTLFQFYNRSVTEYSSNPHSLPAMCASDVKSYVPPDPSLHSSNSFLAIRSVPSLISSALARFPSLSFPASTDAINTTIARSAALHWEDTAAQRYRVLKPCIDTPMYLSVDTMPAAVIRGRIRLNRELSHQRMWKYGRVESSNCPVCGIWGNIEHILMQCPVFRRQRVECMNELNRLYYPVYLTMDLIRGESPPKPPDKTLHNERQFLLNTHMKCIEITGKFLTSVSSHHFL